MSRTRKGTAPVGRQMNPQQLDLAALAWRRWHAILVNPPVPITDPARALAAFADHPRVTRPGLRRRKRAAIWAELIAQMEPETGIIATYDVDVARAASAAIGVSINRGLVCDLRNWAAFNGLLTPVGDWSAEGEHCTAYVVPEPCACAGPLCTSYGRRGRRVRAEYRAAVQALRMERAELGPRP